MSQGVVRGSCLCGSVRWRVERALESMTHCHCSMCRKSHGAPFATYVNARAASFRWLQGEAQVVSYRASALGPRCFCGQCGSIVPGPDVEGERQSLPAGGLEGALATEPVAHIFVASKAAWYPLPDDGLPRFDAFMPEQRGESLEREVEASSEPGWVRGSCLCGASAFELASGGWTLMQCHCSRCRRARSAAHGGNLFAAAERFRWIRGEAGLRLYRLPEAERFGQAFCTRCGSSMPRNSPFGFVVPAGSLDGDPGIVERRHIFVGSKAPWFTIADTFPQFEALPPR